MVEIILIKDELWGGGGGSNEMNELELSWKKSKSTDRRIRKRRLENGPPEVGQENVKKKSGGGGKRKGKNEKERERKNERECQDECVGEAAW